MNDRLAEEMAAAPPPAEKPPLIPGSRTTEFWVVIAALVPWAADQFGIDYDMVIDAAGDVAQAVGADDGNNMPMAIAAVYVLGRILLKYFRGR